MKKVIFYTVGFIALVFDLVVALFILLVVAGTQ